MYEVWARHDALPEQERHYVVMCRCQWDWQAVFVCEALNAKYTHVHSWGTKEQRSTDLPWLNG